MKFRNQFLKYKLHCQQSPDAGGEPGGGNNAGEPAAEKPPENNNDSNLISDDNIWSNTEEGDEPGGQQQNITVVQEAAPKTPETVFNDHVSGIDFTKGMDVANLQNAIQNGDEKVLNEALRPLGENAYRQMMVDMNKIINQRIDAAKSEMTTQNETATATERAVAQLNATLKYTAEPMFKPVADEVFTRYLQQKGMTVDKAIQKTGEYFSKLTGTVTKQTPQAPGSLPQGGFGNAGIPGGADEGEDWMDFLGHPSA